MSEQLDYSTLPITKFVSDVNPNSSVVGARLEDGYFNSTTGETFVCEDDTFGLQSWNGDQGTRVSGIVSYDHPDLIVGYDGQISGASLLDASGQSRHGEISGASTIAGIVGNALDFDGVNDSVRVAIAAQVPISSDFTICGWSKTPTVPPPSDRVILSQYPDPSAASQGRMSLSYISASSDIRLFVGGSPSESALLSATTDWVFWIVERVSGVYAVEINDTTRAVNNSTHDLYNGNLYLGGVPSTWPTVISDYLGQILPLRIFNRGLTSSEKSELYNGGAGV